MKGCVQDITKSRNNDEDEEHFECAREKKHYNVKLLREYSCNNDTNNSWLFFYQHIACIQIHTSCHTMSTLRQVQY